MEEWNLLTEESCAAFLDQAGPQTIAARIRQDEKLCEQGRLPSLLVHHLPPASSRLGFQIASYLIQSNFEVQVPRDVKILVYDSVRQRILDRTARFPEARESIEDEFLNFFSTTRLSPYSGPQGSISTKLRPTPTASTDDEAIPISTPNGDELATTLRVLDRLKYLDGPSFSKCVKAIEDHMDHMSNVTPQQPAQAQRILESNVSSETYAAPPWEETIRELREAGNPPKRDLNRSCYICRYKLEEQHPSYPALCMPCGKFNLAGSHLSLPQNLNLQGKVALVTGGRVNLGYHTALRLLRCHASVIVSSRYPFDAMGRFEKEPDSAAWKDHLRIIGADFRAAKDAFQLVNDVKAHLRDSGWGQKLDILINNAAQTLTDSLPNEERAVQREGDLSQKHSGIRSEQILGQNTYKARIRGGNRHLLDASTRQQYLLNGSNLTAAPEAKPSKSSWVQSLKDIPYEDVITAHSVNTFVPLILCRELLPIMGVATSMPGKKSTLLDRSTPAAYIVNVSSREGIFETDTNSRAKNGRHVHTNMSKAALNMIAETEAAGFWREKKVAMNTVDPGYMSAAPEVEGLYGERPLGWEDGAARVLWPIAIGEKDRMGVWGRFLKHYGAERVDPGVGRG